MNAPTAIALNILHTAKAELHAHDRRRLLLAGFLLLLSFVGTCAAISYLARGWPGPAPLPLLDAKLTDLARNGAAIDTLFIGSSHVATQLDPVSADAGAAAEGCSLHSYNLGVPRLNWLEQRYLVRRTRALNLPHLRWVFMDLPLNTIIPLDHVSDERIRYFTHPGDMRTALDDLWSVPHSILGRLWRTVTLFLAFAYDETGTGDLASVLFRPPLNPVDADEVARIDFTRRGFMPLSVDKLRGEARARRTEFMLDGMPEFKRRLAALRADTGPVTPLPAYRLDSIRTLVRETHVLAPSIGLLIMPSPLVGDVSEDRALQQAWPSLAPDIPLLNFNDPGLVPEFAGGKWWYDDEHLQEPSAVALSKQIGAALCRAMRGSNAPRDAAAPDAPS